MQFSTNHSALHLTGKERGSESGLDYFGARYYGSSMDRFMSPDWSAQAEPAVVTPVNQRFKHFIQRNGENVFQQKFVSAESFYMERALVETEKATAYVDTEGIWCGKAP